MRIIDECRRVAERIEVYREKPIPYDELDLHTVESRSYWELSRSLWYQAQKLRDHGWYIDAQANPPSRSMVDPGFYPVLRTPLGTMRHHLWTEAENDQFRFVHDLVGHGGWLTKWEGARVDFSLIGEGLAYRRHKATLPKAAWLALVGETAVHQLWFYFGPHVQWDWRGYRETLERWPLKDRPYLDQIVLPESLLTRAAAVYEELIEVMTC